MNAFEEKIKELGTFLNVPLHASKETFCTLDIQGLFKVHLEYEPNQERILMASFLCTVPPGYFREEIFKEALKSNSLLDAFGVFAFSEKNNQLVFFLYLPINSSAETLKDTLLYFVAEGKKWKEAVETGQIHLVKQVTAPSLKL